MPRRIKQPGQNKVQGPRPWEPGQVFEAQDIYCVDRLTFEAVAGRTGVSVATLKRWADKFSWRAKREELAQAESRIRFDTYLARQKMLNQVIEGGGALDAFAVAKLETLSLEQARFRRETETPAPPLAVSLETQAQAAALLEEALGRKLAALLAEPARLDLKTIRDLREALKLVAEMRGPAEEGKTATAGLTPETEARIKRILKEGL